MGFPSFSHMPAASSYRRPAVSYGSFVLDGANDPSVFSGSIESVSRLENALNPFFRVRFSHDVSDASGQRGLHGVCLTAVHSDVATDFGSMRQLNLVDDGGSIRLPTRELDFQVELNGVSSVDQAGVRVDFALIFDLSPRNSQ